MLQIMLQAVSPLNSPETTSAKFCLRSFLARQQKETYNGKTLLSLHYVSMANQTILQVS